ncbi:unnamed protein product, partial [Ectocarpus sp. 12 AP-2014]
EATETSSAARAGDFHPAASTRPYRESYEEALRQDGGAEGRRGRYAGRLLGLRRAKWVHPQRVPGHATQRHLGRGARHSRVRGCCGRGLRRARRRHDRARAHP